MVRSPFGTLSLFADGGYYFIKLSPNVSSVPLFTMAVITTTMLFQTCRNNCREQNYTPNKYVRPR